MENLILWGVPVIGALIGLGSRLFKSYTSLHTCPNNFQNGVIF